MADGPVDVAGYGAVLVECGPWLDEQSAGMIGVMQAASQVRAAATQTTFAQADGLYRELAAVCRIVVAEVAAAPDLPREVWSAPTTAAESSAAILAGREADWAALVKLGDRWDRVHDAGALLRESGALQSELAFPGGCPTAVGTQFLG